MKICVLIVCVLVKSLGSGNMRIGIWPIIPMDIHEK